MPINIKIQGVSKFKEAAMGLRRSRLALRDRLYKDAALFGLDTIRHIHDEYMNGPRPGKLGIGTGALRRETRSRVDQSSDSLFLRFGNPLPYARIHEEGGTIRVTKEMRGAFWYMFKKTGDDKYKYMALTRKQVFTIKARPFLHPGVADMLPKLRETLAATLKSVAKEGLSGGQ